MPTQHNIFFSLEESKSIRFEHFLKTEERPMMYVPAFYSATLTASSTSQKSKQLHASKVNTFMMAET